MMTTNKEVIEKLESYFLEQDHKAVCRLLANMMIDMHRMSHIKKLPVDELIGLLRRQEFNKIELEYFIKNGPRGPLTMETLE
jgi:hypothetical protein